MNRIDAIFSALRANHRRALMPFITAGDPDLASTARLLPAIQSAVPSGSCICEIGFPFSDPIADGPVIQESMNRALLAGTRPAAIFDTIARLRSKLSIGLIAMVSYSIVHRLDATAFIRDAASAGFDGFIFPDLPIEESAPVCDLVHNAGLVCSFLISPTTPPDRAARIAKACTGFVYLLSRAGLTGERSDLPQDLTRRIAAMRTVTDLPIAVGFGISTAEHVRQVTSAADAAIVGAALVRRIADSRGDSADLLANVSAFLSDLAGGLTQQSPV